MAYTSAEGGGYGVDASAADVLDLLAGSPTPGQYAQAQPTSSPHAIGKVEKVIGNVPVIRNGVAIAASVSIGGPGNDNFVFNPGIGPETIVNFNPQHDTVELDHFTNAQATQQLESIMVADPHGDAVLELGHHDSITFAGVAPAQLLQVVQQGHILLH